MNDDEKIGPLEASKMFFDMLQQKQDAIIKGNASALPWCNQTYGEDRWVAEEAMRKLYAKLGLKEPRFAWASSPRAMFEAINLLRAMRGQREKVIDSLIPTEESSLVTEVEARRIAAARVVLDAMLDRDLIVSVGAPLKAMLNYPRRLEPPSVVDLSMRFAAQTFTSQGGSGSLPGPPTSDVTIYPALHSAFIGPMQQQVLCMAPYLKVCWFALPPVATELYDDGHLKHMTFRDGFAIEIPHIETNPLLEECVIDHEHCPYKRTITDGFHHIVQTCACEHHDMTPEECEVFFRNKKRKLESDEELKALPAPESADS